MSQDIIYSHSEDDPSRVLIPSVIVDQLNQFQQTGLQDLEAGGLLLGLRRGPHIEIVRITSPLQSDIRTRTSFHRRDLGHFELADQHWMDSQHTVGYVGEWHTHPEPLPTPSLIDATEWRRVMRTEKRATIFLIVGTCNWFVGRGPVRTMLWPLPQKWERLRRV
ncbi:MAG: Mov34/MPN/PAD-1 family protein [Denitratisoma sp.]|nr:Mov34/MPN/PAD-1 family protein [Denitratisoma sp.]